MITKIKSNWLKLDPSNQYMTWIITFCLILTISLGGLVTYVYYVPISKESIQMMMLGIFGFLMFFVFVVLYLTVYWPHHYEKAKAKIKN